MDAKIVYLHLPRTSGTSVTAYLQSQWPRLYVQANARTQLDGRRATGRVRDLDDIQRVLRDFDGLVLHVDADLDGPHPTTGYRSLAWHVFDPVDRASFADCRILMMLREPWRAFLSTFAFVRRAVLERADFLPDLTVTTAEDFLEAAHENAILHFLLEPDLARRRPVTRSDLERVVEAIDQCPIHVGIFERHAESVDYFGRVLGRALCAADVPFKNVGHDMPRPSPALEARFRERNALDFELYDRAAQVFADRVGSGT
jgi:hypothetical protein